MAKEPEEESKPTYESLESVSIRTALVLLTHAAL